MEGIQTQRTQRRNVSVEERGRKRRIEKWVMRAAEYAQVFKLGCRAGEVIGDVLEVILGRVDPQEF